MSIKYRNVRKGIKGAEYDKLRYHGNLIWSAIIGTILGLALNSLVVGIIAFVIGGIICARRYFEMGKD